MRIRNRKSYLTNLPEGTAPKRQPVQWMKYIYICLLFLIFAYLLWYGAKKIIYVEARGQVEVGQQLINASRAGILRSVIARPGLSVKKDTALALIVSPAPEKSLSQNKDILKNQRDLELKKADMHRLNKALRDLSRKVNPVLPDNILKIDQTLSLKNLRLQQIQALESDPQKTTDAQPQQNNRERLLELKVVNLNERTRFLQKEKERFLEYQQEKDALATDIAALARLRQNLISAKRQNLKNEIAALREEIKALHNYGTRLQGQSTAKRPLPQDQAVQATEEGTIESLFKKEGEHVNAGDLLFALKSTSPQVVVHGYFDQRYLSSLAEGKMVSLRFPDGFEGTGVITKFYSIAVPYNEPIRDGYIPIPPAILVEIAPGTEDQEEQWRSYDRMDVTLRLKK